MKCAYCGAEFCGTEIYNPLKIGALMRVRLATRI